MARWNPSQPIDSDDINHGNEFVDNDGVRAEDINNTVKAALYAQETAEQVREDVSDLDDRVTELEEGGSVTADPALSFTSENPVQNKVVTKALRGATICKFVTTAANTTITLQNLTGMTSIDWGDGTVDSNLTHTYAEAGTYYSYIYGMTATGTGAFSGIVYLKGIIISDEVTSIGNATFKNCSGLAYCKLSNQIKFLNSQVFYGAGITSLQIPDSVTNITSSTFENSSLKDIHIPVGVVQIGNNCFIGCSGLTKITISSGSASIAQGAFNNCTALKKIIFECNAPPTLHASGIFDNTNNCPIYVPLSALNAYKTATNWSTYASRIVANATTDYVDTRVASIDPIPKFGIYQNQWVTDHGNVFNIGVSIESMNYMCQCRFCGTKIYHSETVSGHAAITCPTCGQSSYLTEEGFTSDTSGGSTTPHYWRDEGEDLWKDYADYPNPQVPLAITDGACPVCSALFDYNTAWFADDCPNCNTRLMFGAVDGVEPNIYIDTP